MNDAYLPPELKDSCLGKDYQRIANELRDRGTEIVWAGNDAYLKNVFPHMNCNDLFMYPTMMTAKGLENE